MSLWLFGLDHLGLIQAPYNRRTKCLKRWSGREDLNLRPPGPELSQYKFQVLHLVSLRDQKALFSLAQLYRSCTEAPAHPFTTADPRSKPISIFCRPA